MGVLPRGGQAGKWTASPTDSLNRKDTTDFCKNNAKPLKPGTL